MKSLDADPSFLKSLFSILKNADYYWSPLSPDRWMKCREQARENPERFDPWVRCFGLGLEVAPQEFEGEFEGEFDDEFSRQAAAHLHKFTVKNSGLLSSPLGVSRTAHADHLDSLNEPVFVAHSHWNQMGNADTDADGAAYIGQESATLIHFMKGHSFHGQRVLDLGCGAGALSLSVASHARAVLGLDRSASATRLALASARAQGFEHLDFQNLSIGTTAAENYARTQGLFDVAVMNPPMAIPENSARPERDGGHLGIELPLLFLDFAHRHLVKGGTLFMLATNPVTKRSREGLFFEALRARIREQAWALKTSSCVDRHFNQALSRKHQYTEQGVEQVELWVLKLQRSSHQ